MENVYIKSKINKLNKNTKEILDVLISDCLLEIAYRNRISKDRLERISLFYLSIFGKKNYLEYDELKVSEKSVILKIISKGIASIYVDEEYITNDNYKDKLVIIDDMLNLLCYLTAFSKSMIKRLVIRDIKIYFNHGWKWDFI